MERVEVPKRHDIFIMVCPYCEKVLNQGDIQDEITSNQDKLYNLRTSHGICPSCLYKHFPKAYVAIQQKSRVRIKTASKKGYSALQKLFSNK